MCRLIGFVVVALLVPGPSWAQTAHPTFETVGSVLKAGETVVVTCENCEKGKIRGRLSRASASAIATFLYLKFGAGERWPVTLAITAGCWLFFFGLFDYALQLPFPQGAFFDWVHFDIAHVRNLFAAGG